MPLPLFNYLLSDDTDFTQSLTVCSDGDDENRLPSRHVPPFAAFSSRLPLSPSPELADVQNGITVFPLKSFLLTKLLAGHAAMPHQMG